MELLAVFFFLQCLVLSIQQAAISTQCNSKDCKRNKERVEYLIDNSVDPCEDFFQYACSSKKRGKEFPFARKKVTQNLTKLIGEASGDFSFLKDFYESCVSITTQFSKEEVANYCLNDNKCPKEELEKFDTVYQQFRENAVVFAKKTSWPVLTDDWESKSKNFTWQKLSEDILKHEYYLGAFQYVNEKHINFTDKECGRGRHIFPSENFLSNVFFAPMIDHSVLESLLYKRGHQYTSKLHIIPMSFPKFLQKGDFQVLGKYKELMVTSMKLLGQTNETIIEEDMNKVLNNELKLAKLSKPEYSYDLFVKDDDSIEIWRGEEVTLDEMNELFPSCKWIEFVNNVMRNPDVKVNGSEVVLIPGKKRLVDMYKLINELPKREQANLLLWRIFAKFSANFMKTGREEGTIYKNIFDTEGTTTSRSENCVNQVKSFFPNILDDLIINQYLEQEEKDQILEMFQQIKDEFENIINGNEWMSEKTQIEAIKKLKKMNINIGEIHNNVNLLPETLKQLKSDNYLNNIRILGNSFWENQVLNLRAPKDAFSGEGEDNAFYWAIFNQIQINVGLTKGNGIGFSKNLPRALVYGGFTASTLGHELTHGFDDSGSQFDENGVYRNWWDPKSKDEFDKKAECMVKQYNNFTFNVDGKTYRVNGTNTLGENIADNGGIKIGYRAFVKVNRDKKEIIPPGLNLTAQQLFWIGYAQDYCLLGGDYEYYDTFQDALYYENNPRCDVTWHAPAPWRVNTVLSNQRKFAEDFQCPVGSKLNPTERCIVW